MPDGRRHPSAHLAMVIASIALAAAAGCKAAEVTRVGGSTPDGSGGGSGSAPARDGSVGTGSFFTAPEAGAAQGPDAGDPAGLQCAESGAQAQQVPVDLLLLVDSSGSMAQVSGTSTKWALATEALHSFVKDPRSAGLGLGLSFFPKLAPEKTCTSNAQCGGATPFGRDTCLQKQLCGKPGLPLTLSGLECDSPLDECEDPTYSCLPVGKCSASGDPCLGIGMPCVGGAAGDVCQARAKACELNSDDWCPQAYDQATVAISALPANEPALTRALGAQRPFGGTPLGPAVRGGIALLKADQMANPGRPVAMILVSDGLPDGFCGGNFAADIVGQVAAARAATPPIPTYVIGVFNPLELPRARPVLEQLATAGGTGQPFILMTSGDLGQRFQDALNQIRGTALACEFTIPTSTAAIDYGKVNVRWSGATTQEDLAYVGSADRCDPTRGGWYYDVDPTSGSTPRRVLICASSCQKFKGDASGKVELRFGCKTRTIE